MSYNIETEDLHFFSIEIDWTAKSGSHAKLILAFYKLSP